MNVVILAAGMGKRMQSARPKVLHLLAGKPLLAHVVDTADTLQPDKLCIVYGHGGDAVPSSFNDGRRTRSFALQARQLGTGHAVAQAMPQLNDNTPTLVLYGDVPLTSAATLQRLLSCAGSDKLAILTVTVADPTGYGRIVREHGKIVRIVEQKDANQAERHICEINTGILVAPTAQLRRWLAALSNDNAQGEYYLTDIIASAVADGIDVVSAQPADIVETLGVNSKQQLAELERLYQRRIADALLEQGVTLLDPARLDVRGALHCGRDVSIDVNCLFEGTVHIDDGAIIGANCIIRNARIGPRAEIKAFSHIDGAVVGAAAQIGPYARLRPGTELGEEVRIGNFVEIKQSRIAAGSKANHLTYIGNATIGEQVNVGAGVITCNYDGINKFETVIEDNVFIGSNSQLVAPVHVGQGATIGAGTTLTKDAPAGQLTLSRAKQLSLASWQRPLKIKSN